MNDKGTISFSTVLGTIAVVAAVACVLGQLAPLAFQQGRAELQAERGWSSIPAATREVRATQSERIANYAWIDKPRGVVAIPIERAMELVVSEHARTPEGGR